MTENVKELTRRALAGDRQALQQLRERGVLASREPGGAKQEHSYPVSYAQRRLWIFDRMTGNHTAYNMPGALIIKGGLDVDGFKQAFFEVVRRHEALRTIFIEKQGQPCQQILSSDDAAMRRSMFEYLDYSNQTHPVQAAEQRSAEDASKPFDPSRGPLIRMVLIRLAGSEPGTGSKFFLMLNMHHIISDGWSIDIIVRDLCTLYNAYVNKRDNPLPPLSIQYRDYSAWQRRFVESEASAAHRAYWLDRLSGDIPVLQMPVDFSRPPVQTFNGDKIRLTLPADISGKLNALALESRASLFMVLLTLIKVLIYRYTGQTDIIVGSPFSGRNHPDIEDQVGFFVNTLPLRDRIDAESGFLSHLQRVIETVTQASEHQMYPVDKLVEELGLRRDLSRSPLYDIVVARYENFMQRVCLDGIDSVPFELNTHTSKFDLAFMFRETGGIIELDIEYNTDIFEKDRIQRMSGHIKELAQNVILEPDLPVSRIKILPQEENIRILNEFNETRVDYPIDTTLPDLFRRQANETPDRAAIVFEDKTIRYRQLDELSAAVARYLILNCHVRPDDRVAVVLHRSHWYVIAMLGVLKAGAAYVPIDPGYPVERIGYMIEDSACRLVLTENRLKPLIKGFEDIAPVKDICLIAEEKNQAEGGDSKDVATGDNGAVPGNKLRPSNLAYVIYTSGSTGVPKGVQIEHRSLLNLIFWHNNAFDVTEESRATLFAGVGFDASVWETWPYLLKGACLYPLSDELKLDLKGVAAFFDKNRITHAFVPSPICNLLADEMRSSRNHITLLTGGDVLKPMTGINRHVDIINNYGPTEYTVVATSCQVKESDIQMVPIGKPVDNTLIYILDANLQPVPIGVPGELCIAGAGLSRGYLNQPELVAQRFVSCPFSQQQPMYRTGDICRWMSDGNIVFVGRNDDQMEIRGYRVEPGEVAVSIKRCPNVRDAVVVAIETVAGQKELAAYVLSEKSEAGTLDLEAVRNALKKLLPDFMIPGYFVELQSFPLTANGKIDHRALPDPLRSSQERKGAARPPQSDMQIRIADIWKKELMRETINLDDNFFDIGGNSLHLVNIRSKIETALQRNINVLDLFKYPTVQALADFLEDRKSGDGDGESLAERRQSRDSGRSSVRLQRQARLRHRKETKA